MQHLIYNTGEGPFAIQEQEMRKKTLTPSLELYSNELYTRKLDFILSSKGIVLFMLTFISVDQRQFLILQHRERYIHKETSCTKINISPIVKTSSPSLLQGGAKLTQ